MIRVERALKALMIGMGLGLIGACASLQGGPAPKSAPEPVAAVEAQKPSPFILISIDAFRADYLDRGLTPNLKALADGGAHAVMRPSFPSLTFPNHYALVTGKTPDHNGIVANAFRDPARPGVTFGTSKLEIVTDRFWWDDATPFWVSAERAGQKVGNEFWPGSQADIQGFRPSYAPPYDMKVTSNARVDQVLAWVDLPADQRPADYLLYFDVVDEAGHNFGPPSREVNTALQEVDSAIGKLRDGLKARGLSPNMIVVADHGMAAISADRVYYLEDLLPRGSYDLVYVGTIALLQPASGHEAEIEKGLIDTHYEHMSCWHKAKVPARLKYGTSRRIPEIVCLADVGWLISSTHARGPGYKAGAHGFDPAAPEMAALFIANGPDIKPGVTLTPFDNVSVYSLIMKLLHLRPEPNDGNPADTEPALKP